MGLQGKAVTMDSEAKLGPGIRARSARTLCQERAITQKGGGRARSQGKVTRVRVAVPESWLLEFN